MVPISIQHESSGVVEGFSGERRAYGQRTMDFNSSPLQLIKPYKTIGAPLSIEQCITSTHLCWLNSPAQLDVQAAKSDYKVSAQVQ